MKILYLQELHIKKIRVIFPFKDRTFRSFFFKNCSLPLEFLISRVKLQKTEGFDTMKKTVLCFLLLAVLLYILPLGLRDMFSPDETRYAEIGREMAVSGDWVTPRLNGVLYFEKPILGYWLFAGSEKLFGENAFAVRLPCALATLLSALVLFFLTRRFSGLGAKSGLLASGFFLLTPIVFGLGVVATLDPVFSSFLTLAMSLFYAAVQSSGRARTGWLFLFGLAAGAAFLTKGFLAFVLPGLSIFGWLCWTRRWKEMLTLPWIPLLAVLVIVLPWAVMIHQAQPDYWSYFVYDEHIKRFFEKEQHPEPFWFFVPVLVGGLGWFLLLLPAALRGYAKKIPQDDFTRYLLCWTFLPFLFLSMSTGKLATYILPCFAPLAILFATGLTRSLADRKLFRIADVLLLAFAVLLPVAAVGLAAVQLSGVKWAPFAVGEGWKWGALTVAGLLLSVLLFFAVKEKNGWNKLALFGFGLCPVLFMMHIAIPDVFLNRRTPCPLLEKVKKEISPETKLMSYRHPFQAVNWVFRSSDVYMYRVAGEISWGLDHDPEMKARRLLDVAATNRLIEENRGRGGVLLVLPTKVYLEDAHLLPEPEWVKANTAHHKGYTVVKF